jgi:AAA domain
MTLGTGAQGAELRATLERCIQDPDANAGTWTILAGPKGLLHATLRRAVIEVAEGGRLDPDLIDCFNLVRKPALSRCIAAYYAQRYPDVPTIDTPRLTRNVQALVATSLVAAAMYNPSPGTEQYRRTVASLIRSSAELLLPAAMPLTAPSQKLRRAVGSDSVSRLHSFFDDFQPNSPGSPAARYWTLYWMGNENSVQIGPTVSLPIASFQQGTNNVAIDRLDLWRMDDREELSSNELFEHPETALLPLGIELLQGVERAWRISSGISVIWRIVSDPKPMDGDSLSAAIAVGLHKLSRQQPLLRSCLILGRLDTTTDRLLPVGHQFEKIRQAGLNGIRTAVVVTNETMEAPISYDQLAVIEQIKIKLVSVATFQEAIDAASGFFPDAPGGVEQKLLGRYTRRKRLEHLEDGTAQCYLVEDDDRIIYLVKRWPILDLEDEFRRAVWNQEVRNIYRLSSSSRAEECLVIMRDAGVDRATSSFVMVLESPGYSDLDQILANRNLHYWLTAQGQQKREARALLWSGLLNVARGIDALHRQHMVHLNVTAASVFLAESAFDSWRLGGFERVLRFGEQLPIGPPEGEWGIPPEASKNKRIGISFEDDWYGFGMVAARCFYRLEAWKNLPADDLNMTVVELIRSEQSPLTDDERRLILRLIAPSSTDRLTFGIEIIRNIESLVRVLGLEEVSTEAEAPLVLIINHKQTRIANIVDEALACGFVPDPGDKEASYSHELIEHRRRLSAFIEGEVRGGSVYSSRNPDQFMLVGRHMTLMIGPFKDKIADTPPNWDFAFVFGTSTLADFKSREPLKDLSVRVDTLYDRDPQAPHRSWLEVLPILTDRKQESLALSMFQEFLRCTNQLELIMRQSEIFPYELVTEPDITGGVERVRLRSRTLESGMKLYVRTEGGVREFLQRQIESQKKDCDKVLLSAERALRWRPSSNAEQWQITRLDDDRIELQRRSVPGLPRPAREGYLRVADFHGQVRLIRRRQEAIERLKDHTYLLKALVQPNSVLLDTGQTTLPVVPNKDLDEMKIAAMRDILRVRPLYVLQGPPGTGKTTLVAHLLAQILADDPVSQILVTAQAHGAVDVLREKVDEVFRGHPPLSVRLGVDESADPDQVSSGTVEQRAAELLAKIADGLSAQTLSPLQKEWQEFVRELISAAGRRDTFDPYTEFQELVRRGASIIYCTTSAGDLEELAKGEQFFDWVVLEEAGKVHGYDLALPLQAGHRWLLLGDHKQLEPYRIADFQREIEELDLVREKLDALSLYDRPMVDTEWICDWNNRTADDKTRFKDYAKEWLQPFKQIFRLAQGFRGLTPHQPGAAAGTLTSQYRMHPAIGRLVSQTFYDGLLNDKTSEESMLHTFQEPYAIDGKALVWLDTLWCKEDGRFEEHGEPRYTNEMEVQAVCAFLSRLRFSIPPQKSQYVAVLSPYNQQVRRLNSRLREIELPRGLEFRESLRARRPQAGPRYAHTVDSFQGNQADIVIISLVRNNTYPLWSGDSHGTPDPLGFLRDEKRLNVLVSRAERLLVIVGSWRFFKEQLRGLSPDAERTTPLLKWQKLMNHFHSSNKSATTLPFSALTRGGK